MSDGSNQKDFIENADGSLLLDHKGQPISVDKFLSTKPLRKEVSTRQGPGGMKLSYMGGDVITKTLNEAFGYDGWSLEVKDKTQLDPMKDDKGRYIVAFTATVRITHLRTGAFREDCGAGDAIDRSLASASGNALKGAVTDAMKRAARHFGEKLGNSLYHDDFSVNKAPNTLKDACDMLDLERAKGRFGFDKDRKKMIPAQQQQQQQSTAVTSSVAVAATTTTTSQTAVKGGGGLQHSHNNNYTKPPPPLYVGGCVAQTQQQTPRTVQSTVSNQPKTKNSNASKPYVTPHHGMMNSNRTPGNGIAPSRPATAIAATSKVNENANPQTTKLLPPPKTGGLNLPKRPGTSRGVGNNNSLGGDEVMKAFYGSSSDVAATTAAPSMFERGGGMSQALMTSQQSLKRKSDGADGNPNPMKNPYTQS
ncbi:RAD52 family DNA repair protein [Skeletonema marinoi]|uniref:RAD52 family DNA repair protein n=1 Tax=Skeletonema marinoi TaxID=267567 RepID=A0AAD9D9S1_9STRA|nr:RAD52 family DNA repair protein [Skeletonema marinoi]